MVAQLAGNAEQQVVFRLARNEKVLCLGEEGTDRIKPTQ
jgi:hypothetical protein